MQPGLGERCVPVDYVCCQARLPKHRAHMFTLGSIADIIFPLHFYFELETVKTLTLLSDPQRGFSSGGRYGAAGQGGC